MAKIGFMGLGRMGTGMATRLISAGHEVAVWNRSPGKAEALVSLGAKLAATPASAARGADAVFAMLADDPASTAVWHGATGALGAMRPGAFALECSTLTRAHVCALADAMTARGVRFIDCPVTGRPEVAVLGKLTMLVGASAKDLEDARPYLSAVGETIRHFGPIGAGTSYKLMINLMGAVQIAALAEGLAMAERLGLDRDAVVSAIETSAAASRQVVYHARRMAERRFDNPTFTASLRHKDAAYGGELAHEIGAAIPLGEASIAWFDAAKAVDADGDEARVIEAIQKAGRKSKVT